MSELDNIQVLLQSAPTGGTTFQSIIITSLQTLSSIKDKEVLANEAAISLGQNVRVKQMIALLDKLEALLKGGLNKQGKQLLDLQTSLAAKKTDTFVGSWWTCVQELIETIEHGIDSIGSIISSQPKESLARLLGANIIEILAGQRNELLAEINELHIDK